jgi:hypothetical protein
MESVEERLKRLEGEVEELTSELRQQQIYNRTLDQMNHSAWKAVAKYRKTLIRHGLLSQAEDDD